MIDPDANGSEPPYQPGEKVAAVLEAAHHLIMTVQPADRAGYLQLFALRRLIGLAGGVDGLLRFLPPLEDSDQWDGILVIIAGVVLELRGDDSDPFDADQAQGIGAEYLGALMAEASGVDPPP